MKQICVIGDSHLAALKLGWDAMKEGHPEIKLTFFGAPAKKFRDIRVENGALIPSAEKTLRHLQQTSGGEKEIVPDRFDSFLIVALEFNITKLARLYRNYRAEEHANQKGAHQYVSNACFLQAAKGFVQESLAFNLAKKLRTITDRPVAFLPQPFPSEDIVAKPVWKMMVGHDDHLSLGRTFSQIIAELGQAGNRVLQQPAQTTTNEIFTKRNFSEGSVRLTESFDVEHPDDDYAHMNRDYGITVWESLLPSI